MPTAISGYAGGTLRQLVLQDDGTMTGDGLVVGWLKDNPPPATDIGAVTLHIGKLLTEVHATPLPPAGAAAATAPAEPASGAYTAAELDELTVADLREMATLAHVPDAARMTKAALVAALLAQQGG